MTDKEIMEKIKSQIDTYVKEGKIFKKDIMDKYLEWVKEKYGQTFIAYTKREIANRSKEESENVKEETLDINKTFDELKNIEKELDDKMDENQKQIMMGKIEGFIEIIKSTLKTAMNTNKMLVEILSDMKELRFELNEKIDITFNKISKTYESIFNDLENKDNIDNVSIDEDMIDDQEETEDKNYDEFKIND